MARLLQCAKPFLEASKGSSSAQPSAAPGGSPCSDRAVALLLEACAACAYTPPAAQLTLLYATALRAMLVRDPEAAVLISLATSIGKIDFGGGEGKEEGKDGDTDAMEGKPAPTAPDAVAEGRGGRSGGGSEQSLPAVRESLLVVLAVGLTQGRALSLLSKQPGRLVDAVWQVVLLGPQLPAAWVASYAQLVLSFMPEIKSKSTLARAAAGLALMRAEAKASWLDTLWTRAEALVKAGAARVSGWQSFGAYDLGLLLGAAHALRGDGISSGSGGGLASSSPLSSGAQAAYSRAHSTFVREPPGVMARYRPGELQLVAAAVADFELTRPLAGASGGGGGGSAGGKTAKGGAGKKGTGSGGKQGQMTTTDSMACVEPGWLEACGAALLDSRRRLGLPSALLTSPGATAAFLPSPALLLNLLRLASRVLAGSTDGAIARLAYGDASEPTAGAAAQAEDLLEYVVLSLGDWAAVTQVTAGPAAGAGEGGGKEAPRGLAVGDWTELLRAAIAASVQPPCSALEVYSHAMFESLAEAASGSGGTPSAGRQRALWAAAETALSGVLLRVLPWVPPKDTGDVFSRCFLPAAPLEAATMRQLGLVATYCTQTDLGSEELWERLRAELTRRLQPQEPQQEPPAAQTGREGKRAAGKGGRGAAPARDAVAEPADTAADWAAEDFAALCYALERDDYPLGREALECLAQLEARRQAGPPPADAWFAASPALAPLSALHRISMRFGAYMNEDGGSGLGSTAGGAEAGPMPRCAELAAMSLDGCWAELFDSPPFLDILLPVQVREVLMLYRGELIRRALVNGPQGSILRMPAAFASALLERTEAAISRSELKDQVAYTAAEALALCLPCIASTKAATTVTGNTGSTRLHLELHMVCLAEAAGSGLASELHINCVVGFLTALKHWEGWRLRQEALEAIVRRVMKVQVEDELRSEGPHDEAADEPGVTWPYYVLWEVANALLVLAPPEVPGELHSPVCSRAALDALTPLLVRVVEKAEETIVGVALFERLGRGVRAAGAAAAANAYLQHGPAAGAGLMLESARAAAGATSAMMCALLPAPALPAPQELLPSAAAVMAPLPKAMHAAPPPAADDTPPPAAHGEALLSDDIKSDARFVSALIAAGGARPLPRPLAAIVLLLLGKEGVIQALPAARLQQALFHSLTGHAEELPMDDFMADDLYVRWRLVAEARDKSPPVLTRLLRRCGASAVMCQGMINGVEDVGVMEVWEVAQLLRELYECGTRERAGTWLEHHEGLYWPLFRDAIFSTARRNLLAPSNLAAAVEALHYARLLAARLNRTDVWAVELYPVCRPYAYEANMAPLPRSGEAYWQPPNVNLVWRFVEHMTAVGPVALTELTLRYVIALAAMRRRQGDKAARRASDGSTGVGTAAGRGGGVRNDAGGGGDSTPAVGQRGKIDCPFVQASEALLLRATTSTLFMGPHTLSVEETRSIIVGLVPMATLVQLELNSVVYTKDFAPLSPRELGLAFGLVALRPARMDSMNERGMEEVRGGLASTYLQSLGQLAARTDLGPLELLVAMLDAIQPALCADVGGGQSVEYKQETLPALMEPLAEVLAELLTADEPPMPDGVSAEADAGVLFLLPRTLTEEALMEDLFWPPGTPGRLPLPRHLLPPPGRRHGFGDPEGDAAREAYVREVAPWYLAARRLQAAVFPAVLEGVVDLKRLLEERGLLRPGAGRWSALLWAVVESEPLAGVWEEARAAVHANALETTKSKLPHKVGGLQAAVMLELLKQLPDGLIEVGKATTPFGRAKGQDEEEAAELNITIKSVEWVMSEGDDEASAGAGASDGGGSGRGFARKK